MGAERGERKRKLKVEDGFRGICRRNESYGKTVMGVGKPRVLTSGSARPGRDRYSQGEAGRSKMIAEHMTHYVYVS